MDRGKGVLVHLGFANNMSSGCETQFRMFTVFMYIYKTQVLLHAKGFVNSKPTDTTPWNANGMFVLAITALFLSKTLSPEVYMHK